MKLHFSPINESYVRVMLTWRYDPPYDVYNFGSDEDDAVQIESAVAYFTNPIYSFFVLLDAATNVFIGAASFGFDGQVPGGDYTASGLDIGLAIHPEWTGRGFGDEYIRQVTNFAEKQFSPSRLRVTIAEFNQRAQTVWRRAGFQFESSFIARHNQQPFLIFVRDVV